MTAPFFVFGQYEEPILIMATGVHENVTGKVKYFTTAQFHRPEELEEEVTAADFSLLQVVGLEGRWSDSRCRQDILRVARAFEAERSVRGISAHLLAVARRPKSFSFLPRMEFHPTCDRPFLT
jgi:hypothetical protein